MSEPQPEELLIPGSPGQPPHPTPLGLDDPPRSPSRPSSSGSTKRPPQDDISELVRKAKASRYAQPVRRSSEDDIAEKLERDLSCAICSEILTNPVACIDCLHNFCGSCLVPWFERNNTCPTCRQVVKNARDNHSTAASVETLLNLFPDKKRDPEELKELELIYKPGQKINIPAVYNDEDDDQQNGDNDGEEEEEEEESHILWPPCPCCTPGNPHGFTCPDPIPPPDPVAGFHVADVYSHRNHLHCNSCPNTFPTAWKLGWKCDNCPLLYCGNLFQCAREGVLQVVPDQVASITAVHFPLAPTFRGNPTEARYFDQWRSIHNHTASVIASKIYAWLIRKNDGYFPASSKRLSETEYVCNNCVVPVITNNFLDWWCSEKLAEGFVDGRERCWYGRGCRTQFHNLEHAERLAHAWEEMTPAERHQATGRGRRVPRLVDAGDGGQNEGALPVANTTAADDILGGDAAPVVDAAPGDNVPVDNAPVDNVPVGNSL